jgi:hypothetical protein
MPRLVEHHQGTQLVELDADVWDALLLERQVGHLCKRQSLLAIGSGHCDQRAIIDDQERQAAGADITTSYQCQQMTKAQNITQMQML